MNITVNFDSLEEMKAFAVALIEEGAAEVIKTANQTAPTTPVDPAPVQPQPASQVPVPPTQPTPQVPVQQPVPVPPTQPTPQVPVQQPVQPQPTPQVPVQQPQPAPQVPVQQPQPVPPTQPVQPQPTSQAPVTTSTPQYTLEDLARAAVPLQDAGRGQDLMALLQKYNVMSMTQLDPSVFGAFATDLRALGAQI